MRRLQTLEIQHLRLIEHREMYGLAGRIAQPLEVSVGLLPEIEARRDHVAEHEALDPELILAADLGDEAGLFEGGQQTEGGGPRNPRARGEIGKRQPRLAKRECAEQIERLRRRVHGIAAHRHRLELAFHWAKWYI